MVYSHFRTMTGRCFFSSMANSTLIANYNEANSSTIATCLLNTWVQAKRHAIYMIQIPESDLSGKNYDLNRCVSNKHGNYSKSSFHSSLNQHTTYHWSASNLLEQKKASYSFSINWTHFDCTLILNELNTIPNISRHIIQQQSKSLWLPRKKWYAFLFFFFDVFRFDTHTASIQVRVCISFFASCFVYSCHIKMCWKIRNIRLAWNWI